MVPYKLIVRFPAVFTAVPAGLFVNVFHRWIQDQSVADHLAIDVADYAHVAGGPGTLLVCSEANIHVDSEGLIYVRKRPFAEAATLAESVERSVRTGLELAEKLEGDPTVAGHFRRRRGELDVRFNDRLLTPNTPETAASVIPQVALAITKLFRGESNVTAADGSPSELLELKVTVAADRG
jgi:hypothetical protein